MQSFRPILTQPWFQQLSSWQQELVHITVELYEREERMMSSFSDYSFLVFPIGKAYEGFLKQYFYDIHLIDERTYMDKRFRIGKALNPDLSPHRKDELWLFDGVKDMCGLELANMLWQTWLECRNKVFHYFPHNQKRLSLQEAASKMTMILSAMEEAMHCQLKNT